ncbi:MAG TPA: ABC transporter permease [Phycisphaerales bacterium]|nr:ABC transporter permease [Phycisphaerales bacterium]
MRGATAVFKRELSGYFVTPVAYVFIVVFLVLAGVFAWDRGMGGFWDHGQADLRSFFGFMPWLFLFLIPAVSMRMWAEERRAGTIELLLTLPISLTGAVVGKFLAAWVFAAIALLLTFPMWVTVNYLGEPDNGAIATAYLGSVLMAGGFLAVGSLLSAATKSQVVAFILTVVACFALLLAGFTPVIEFLRGWAPAAIVDAVASFSFLTRFDGLSKGVVDIRDLVFFGSLMAVCLAGTSLVLEAKKAE